MGRLFKIRANLTRINIGSLRQILHYFGGHLKPFKSKMFLSFLALMGVSIVTLLRPWPLKLVFDYALLPNKGISPIPYMGFLNTWDPFSIAILAAGGAIGLALIGSFLGYRQEILTKTVGHGITAAIRLQLFSHVQRLPLSYHDYRETGDLMTRLTGDINLLQDLLVENFIRLVGQFVIIIGMIIITFFLDWQLTLLIIAVMPFFLLATVRFSRQIKDATNRQREKYGKMVATMEETLAGISQVKVYRQERRRDKLIGQSVKRDYKAGLKAARLSASYSRIVDIISAVGIGLILLFGVKKAIAGSISVGDLIIFITYVRGIYRPIQTVSRLSTRIAKAVVRGEKVMEVLEIEPEVRDHDNALSAREVKGNIKFENIKFAYVNDNYVLNGLNCTIPPMKTTILIGHTGAGKSTVAKLLLRLYEPQEGNIVLDGNNIAEYKIRSLRKRITSLTQETFLFRTTIRENISFGNHRASDEEIEKAVKLVGAEEFINRLPDGYDTMVGEAGLTLSGGQRQRISFARAALKNSPVMIFDEPATGLDIHAEEEAKKALRALKPDHTLIIITHRLNFIELADWAIFISDGKLIEEGPPIDLIGGRGRFYDYVAQEINQTGSINLPDKYRQELQ